MSLNPAIMDNKLLFKRAYSIIYAIFVISDVLKAIKTGFADCHMAMWRDLGKFFLLFVLIEF
jgi:hypothetical protein